MNRRRVAVILDQTMTVRNHCSKALHYARTAFFQTSWYCCGRAIPIWRKRPSWFPLTASGGTSRISRNKNTWYNALRRGKHNEPWDQPVMGIEVLKFIGLNFHQRSFRLRDFYLCQNRFDSNRKILSTAITGCLKTCIEITLGVYADAATFQRFPDIWNSNPLFCD